VVDNHNDLSAAFVAFAREITAARDVIEEKAAPVAAGRTLFGRLAPRKA
jgi:hypothetical protein